MFHQRNIASCVAYVRPQLTAVGRNLPRVMPRCNTITNPISVPMSGGADIDRLEAAIEHPSANTKVKITVPHAG